jgi:CHAD domain-containing protein
MHLDDTVIDRSVEEGARQVALALLHQATGAAGRLTKREDDEALHDFRVGVRRLRTALRSFTPWLEGALRRNERKLRKIAKASNAARDAEVHLAFLASQEGAGSERRRLGLRYLQDRLEKRRGEGFDLDRVLARFERVAGKLAERLPRYEVRLDDAAPSVPFAAGLASVVREELASVRTRAAGIGGPGDEERVHKTRIAVKRLRYVLEPLRGNAHADTRSAVRELKRLQDVLGDLHDTHTLAQELRAALRDAAAERADRLFAAVYQLDASGPALRDELRGGPRSGLLSLVRVVRERRDALFAELDRNWRGGGLDALAAEVERIIAALELRAGGKVELKRRYLLTALPERVEELPTVEIAMGWLPGEPVRERLRIVRSPDGERLLRDFVQGEGAHRLHVEEETTHEVFDVLWPLTEGRRETRRRREVSDGSSTWWIDELVERNLVVAEEEAPPHAAMSPVPEWLRPFVLRELTEAPDLPPTAGATGESPEAPPRVSMDESHAVEPSAAPSS